MRQRAVCLGLVTAAAVVVPLAGQFNFVSDQPAATLLLPYFEVDLDRPAGQTTLFSVNNASAAPALARVVVWSDLAVPVLGFDVYLTGFDVERIDMRDIIAGQIPAVGLRSSFDCADPPPAPPPPSDVRNALTGQASAALGGCAGLAHGETSPIARGYVTVDNTNNCTNRLPGDAGYFVDGGQGDANNNNELWGDYMLVERRTGTGEANPLVHIRADSTDPQLSLLGAYTFYGRYVGWDVSDNREPLSTTFGVRSLRGAFGETHVTVWRDTKTSYKATSPSGAFACGSTPVWHPLGVTQVVEFDEEEDVHAHVFGDPPLPPSPFAAATQRVEIGGPALPSVFPFGWYFFNLNVPDPPRPEDRGFSPPTLEQAWVTILHRDASRFSIGLPAVSFTSARQ